MNGIPSIIPEFGEKSLKPRQNPAFVPDADFGTEEYFVWSRCDGTASLQDIILMVGFGATRSIEILSKLRGLGAVLLPGETSPPPKSSKPAEAPRKRRPRSRATAPPNDLPPPASAAQGALLKLSDEEKAAMSAEAQLDDQTRLRVIEYQRKLATETTHFDLLGVEVDADKKTVKRAYFRLSKEFHPDRYYGKELGPFAPWLTSVFEAITGAFRVLGDNKKRVQYEQSLRGNSQEQEPQTKAEHAASLFQSGCDCELQGDREQALKLFAAAIRMDEQPKYLRRAAMCAVSARELSVAEEYAKKAADLRDKDASYLRVLADVFRAGNELEKAKEVLQQALALDTENDILFRELQSDMVSVTAAIVEATEQGNS